MTKSSKASRYSDTNMKYKRQNVIIRTILMYLNTPEKNNIYSFVIKQSLHKKISCASYNFNYFLHNIQTEF